MQEFRPKVLGISESSYSNTQDFNDVSFENYSVVFSNTLDNPDIRTSRIAVYIHNALSFKVRNDLMSDMFSSVWIELGKPGQKKILVCMLYREWQLLNQPDDISGTIDSQLYRWLIFLDQWEQAITTGKEICTLGDVNLNFLTWANPNVHLSSHSRKLTPLVSSLFDKVIPHGFVQLVKEATRFVSGREPSGIDHFYSNRPEHISDIQVISRGSSGHRLILGTRFTESIIERK